MRMLLNELDGQVKTNIGEIKTYQVAVDPVIFKMLSSDIYSDKIKAVIRELSTNAHDAMVESGAIKLDDLENSQRFKVHLPTYLEPYFSIRDFGTGLDEEGIEYVYTYGASTRRKSNAYTGALGIGAKSPHSYSKSGFNVNSYYNGTLYSYVSFLNNGEPSYVLNDATPTTEPNGVEVIINVAHNDIYSFRSKAREVYRWFKHKPEFNMEMDFSNYSVLEETDYYSIILENSDYSNRCYAYGVLMGNILYEYPNVLTRDFNDRDRRILEKVIFKAELGEVDFHPSREYLDDSLKTRNFIENKLRNLTKAAEIDINNKVTSIYKDTTKTLFEKAKILSSSLLTFSHVFDSKDYNTLKITKFGRLKILSKRIEKITSRLPWIDRLTYKHLNKEQAVTVTSINMHDTIVILDKPLSYHNVFKWMRKNINEKTFEIKFIIPKYSFFPKLSNGRYDYDKIHEIVKKDILNLLRCNENEVYFSSKMDKDPNLMSTRAPRLKAHEPKIESLRYIQVDKDYWNNRNLHESFDVKNPPNKIHYIRMNNLITKNVAINEELYFKWEHSEDFFNQFASYVKLSGLATELEKIFFIHPSIVSDKMLQHSNYVDAIKLIYEKAPAIERVNSDALTNFKAWFLPSYSSNLEYFVKAAKESFKSEFYKLIKEDPKFIERLNTKKTKTDFKRLGPLVKYETIDVEMPAWYNEYLDKRPGFLDKFRSYKGTYWDHIKIDDLIYIFECAYESGKM